ncbi:AraC family transcriptional regulator [Ruegeria sp. 2012CJ41-6]|uniref:AraC family transcriptional regulator n=1 Tax=Ruegeria spongiae TaxID=2942209 RepID=A0ABT0PXX1_9RHOB|nr:AraC family transcriptional regulator [Ruegeria spongiae]MCL6282466.1 AraC family transcriptional regulator [Ruegeria spongiae]
MITDPVAYRINDLVPIHWLIFALLDRGIADKDLCTQIDCTPTELNDPEFAIPVESYLRLIDWGAAKLGDPDLGLSIGQTARARQFGVLGYIVDNASSVRDLCVFLDHYYEVFTRSFGMKFTQAQGICIFDYSENPLPGSDGRQDIDFSLAVLVEVMRRKIGTDWHPTTTRFTFPRPPDLTTHRKIFGPDVRFGQDKNQLIFDRKILRMKISDADPGLLAIVRQQADTLLERARMGESVERRVRLLLSSRVGHTQLTATEISSDLNISVRKLHRCLSSEGTTFRELRKDVIQSAARSALEFTDASVSEIATRLGFSETSAFVRAFKREEGVSPLKHRRMAAP